MFQALLASNFKLDHSHKIWLHPTITSKTNLISLVIQNNNIAHITFFAETLQNIVLYISMICYASCCQYLLLHKLFSDAYHSSNMIWIHSKVIAAIQGSIYNNPHFQPPSCGKAAMLNLLKTFLWFTLATQAVLSTFLSLSLV